MERSVTTADRKSFTMTFDEDCCLPPCSVPECSKPAEVEVQVPDDGSKKKRVGRDPQYLCRNHMIINEAVVSDQTERWGVWLYPFVAVLDGAKDPCVYIGLESECEVDVSELPLDKLNPAVVKRYAEKVQRQIDRMAMIEKIYPFNKGKQKKLTAIDH
jgi:hypothetical protein